MTVTVNGSARDVTDGATVADVVALLRADPTGSAVAVNDEVVRRAEWSHRLLAAGDRVEVLTAVQGG